MKKFIIPLALAVVVWLAYSRWKKGNAVTGYNIADFLDFSPEFGGYVDDTTGKVYSQSGNHIGNAF